jgi:hypothetical protein
MPAVVYLVTFFVVYKAFDSMIQTTMPAGFEFWKLAFDYEHCVVLTSGFGLLYGASICAHRMIRWIVTASAEKEI